jgi:hypothetical protein
MGGTGGGISNDGNQLTIDDSTISGNTVTPGSGGGPGSNGRGAGIDGSATLAGDILATSGGAPSGGECDRSVTDDGYNVDDDGTCGLTGTGSVSDSPHIDGYLGTLANHGGPTATVALSAGADNPAQAAIPDTFTAPGQSTPSCGQPDQRGVGRGAPCDMGAYALTVPAITSLDSTTFTVGAGGSFQVTESGVPGPTFTEVGSLPAGVSLSPAGLLSGIPAGGSGGTYPITVTASNGVSAPASQAFTLTIDRAPASAAPGYLLAGSDGGVFAFDSTFFGSMGGVHLDAPIVGVKRTPDGDGYWLVGADGGVFAFGDAAYHGSLVGTQLTAPIVGMATTADGRGYWLVGADGGVFAFGDAAFHGSMAGMMLSAPIVGMKRTSDGGGYWLVGADGGVFAFGDAAFDGSMGGTRLRAPIVGIATAGGGKGYWLAGADGGVFAFGGAPFDGSMGGTRLSAPIVGIGEEPPAQIG